MTPGCSDPLRVKGIHLPPRHGGIHLLQWHPIFSWLEGANWANKSLRGLLNRDIQPRFRSGAWLHSWLPVMVNITRFLLNVFYFVAVISAMCKDKFPTWLNASLAPNDRAKAVCVGGGHRTLWITPILSTSFTIVPLSIWIPAASV